MVFHVYVDGVTGTSPEAAWEVSHAMAAHYGVPAAEAYTRLTAGAFCVRANVDRDTAERFARDLAALGARVRIEPVSDASAASGEPPPAIGRPTRSALPPQPLASGRPTRPSLLQMGTQPGTRPSTSALAGAPIAVSRTQSTRPSVPGLAAAPEAGVAIELGALASGALSLSMLDNAPPPARTVTPVPPRPATPVPARPRPALPDAPIDLFAPPSEAGDELAVELAVELAHDEPVVSRTATPVVGRVATAPRPGGDGLALDADVAAASHAIASMRAHAIAHSAGMPAPPGQLAIGSAALTAQVEAAPDASGSWVSDPRRLVAQPRIRLAVGVALAIMLGFLPADLFASAREHSLLRPIDQQVATTQAAADTAEAYQALDAYRDRQLAAKRSQYRWIVLEALLIWAATSGALGALWFRYMRDDRP